MDAGSSDFTLTLPSDREFALTRTFMAPRRLVFEAWTRPEHVRRWYGCHVMDLVACEIDLRVGGAWRYVMRSPDGATHTMQGVYREIAPPARLIYTEGYASESFVSPEAVVTVTFVERDGCTTLTSTVLHPSKESRDGHLGSGLETGAIETLNRLDDLLHLLIMERDHGAA